MNRYQHFLAVKICEYLEIPADRLYNNWACLKVRLSNEDEDTICRAIVDKLNMQKGARFDEIAKTAFDEGRTGLATKVSRLVCKVNLSFLTTNYARGSKCPCCWT